MATPMKSHLITLSFDDGFADSFARTAGIYEEFGMKACLNIIAGASEPGASSADEWHNAPVGDWTLWNELGARGHEIMPHSWDHANLAKIPFADACKNIDRCLEAFRVNLAGFSQAAAVFNFPYNSSTPAVETYLKLKARVRAYRSRGAGGAKNPWPSPDTQLITNSAFGPGNCEEHLDRELSGFLAGPPGWFVYNLHGLDSEGWGPVTTDYLRRLLGRLGAMGHVEVVPAAAALSKYGFRTTAFSS